MAADVISGPAVLRRALRRQRGRVVAGIVLLCTHQAAEALVPVAIGLIIDRAVATGDVRALLLSLVGLAALFTVLAFAYRAGARQAYAAVEQEAHLVRVEIARSALDPRGNRSGMRDGELLSVTASDAELSALVVRVAGLCAAAVTAIVVAAVALLVVDVPLGLGVLLGVPLVVVALQRMAPLLSRRSASQQEALAATTALAVDLVTGLRVLRGIGAQDHAARRYAVASRHALDVTLRAATTKGLHLGLTTTVNGLFLAAVAGVAGWLALQGRLTVGELVAVVGLAQFIAEPVQTLGYCVQLFAMARASAGRVARVLGAEPLTRPGTAGPPAPDPARLTLDTIGYAGLDGLCLRVGAGEVLGVLAYDPGEAEALVRLLSGRVPREDYRGTLCVDGVPAEDLHIDAVRGVLLVEQHDVALFEGTLRANLAAGADVDEAVLRAAVRAAAAEDVLAAHPHGIDRLLTERGANLSGGQRQRIGLARALVADPPVLVLHNPTTAVDAVTEALLAEGLTSARAAAARGTVLITNSPVLLRATHRVAVIDRGRVVAEGPHEQLLARDARYREEVLR
ncbi:putative ABC transport system ATP-binding protein [Micromonospora sp. M71_S20]|uniref:ABC transporter transmembrane domain-containing protein n=1 Tax=Micromonospora sp. M71_S20 TaxID=592872 RepID=UPI000EB168C8|nr:ABC transporter ATP-binding protein [Micromonospora sp. M71_S20]RLK25844.1 putative ABC transport system ATP-binding protein [Micromonospora sp. M71_S20]